MLLHFRFGNRSSSNFGITTAASLLVCASLLACSAPDDASSSTATGGSAGSVPSTGGSSGTSGGSAGAAGATASAGSAGANASGGSAGTSGGSGGSGGSASGGTTSSAGSGGGQATSGCNGAVTSLNSNPFGCTLAWGNNADSSGQRTSYAAYLEFVSSWVLETEPGLAAAIASTDAMPVYYGYIIGDTGHDHGLPDCNLGGPPNLCTDGAQMIRDNEDEIIAKYAAAAKASHDASPNKPAIWLLEGDFIQYHESTQTGGQGPLSYEELGQITADITCAIKANQPNAVVAMNHTTWNGDDETDDFWAAMPLEILDMVWTTGVGNNDGYMRSDGNSGSYNAKTARYDYVATLTGKKIFVDESFGASREADSWVTQSASTLADRVAEGVIAVNLTGTGIADLQSAVGGKACQ